ncbi:flavin reductase family protein [Poriferisphaera sp. WC338]|uniref:flavin reductase family protein n=1 Tax=Poriferisphaera sp. WC338 TaxID=3425129 RepID=UPI003D815046
MASNISESSQPTTQDQNIAEQLGAIPCGTYVLTAQHEDRRMGMLTSWIQQVCFEPPMICVAIAKGRPIMPLVSESRHFALCQLTADDKLIRRKFSAPGDLKEDPFLGHDLTAGSIPGLPILSAALGYMECEVACHMDVEGDHDLFVARIISAGKLNDGSPEIRTRATGFEY